MTKLVLSAQGIFRLVSGFDFNTERTVGKEGRGGSSRKTEGIK